REEAPMGFSNLRTPWSKLARRLEGKDSPPVDRHADGSDAPAFSRPDRYRVSVGPRGPDSRDRYHGATTDGAEASRGPRLRTASVQCADLYLHFHVSFLDGASDPECFVTAGAAAGLSSLALTDHNGLYGAVCFSHAAAEVGLPSVFGAELSVGLREKIPG